MSKNINFLDYYDPKSIINFWSQEHFYSFNNSTDYNHFFYFFHSPKEKLLKDPFSHEETNLLINTLICLYQVKHIESKDLQGNWGLFSLLMPSRNGLSCYSHYLTLKARFSPKNTKGVLADLLENMAPFLKNVRNSSGFCEFFIDLEPGLSQTTNHVEFLQKVY